MIPETSVDAQPPGWQPRHPTGGARGGAGPRGGGDPAGPRPVAAGGGPLSDDSPAAVLQFLAAALRARAAVEVHAGSGENALALLSGMSGEGVLTSIDVDPDAQRRMRRALSEAGVPAGRARLITGQPAEVLPRLTEGGYDLVVVDGGRAHYPRHLQLGRRLLRPGGVIAFAGVRPGRGGPQDAQELALDELARAVDEDDELVPAMIPTGSGLLAVARR